MADDLKMYLERELSCMRYYEAIGAFLPSGGSSQQHAPHSACDAASLDWPSKKLGRHRIFERYALRIVFGEQRLRSILAGKDLQVVLVADLFRGVDVNPDGSRDQFIATTE